MVDFESKRDLDRVREGSPWHVNHHAIILEKFDECMKLSELKFDKLQLWARILNLPFNLRNEKWGLAVARDLDRTVKTIQVDPVGGYLRARVTIDVKKPLRREILIESARRNSKDWYDIQYEQVPSFCFSCGCLGHSDLYCPTPGKCDEEGLFQFRTSLRAPDDRKRTASSEGSMKEQYTEHNKHKGAYRESSTDNIEAEVTSPLKKKHDGMNNKRKGVPQKQVYKRIEYPLLTDGKGTGNEVVPSVPNQTEGGGSELDADVISEREHKKKKPTPTNSNNSAAAVDQPYLSK